MLQAFGKKRFGKAAKAIHQPAIVRFSTMSDETGMPGYEIGRLPGEIASIISPLMGAGAIVVEAFCSSAPKVQHSRVLY